MKTFIFDKNNYTDYVDFYMDLANSIESDKHPNFAGWKYDTFPIGVLLFYRKEKNIKFILKNFDVKYYRYNRDLQDHRYLGIIDFLIDYGKTVPGVEVEIIEDNPTPIVERPITQVIVFNKKDYASHQDFYRDVCIKMDAKNDLNCVAPEDLGCSGDILSEFLWDFFPENRKFVFVGFDREKITEHKTHDDYKYNIALGVFENFVEKFPNNKLEYRDEE